MKTALCDWLDAKSSTLALAVSEGRMPLIDVLSQVTEIDIDGLLEHLEAHAGSSSQTATDGTGEQSDHALSSAQIRTQYIAKAYPQWLAYSTVQQIELQTTHFRRHWQYPRLVAWVDSLKGPAWWLKNHLSPTEQANFEWILDRLKCSIESCVRRQDISRALCIADFWSAEFVMQRFLGVNPTFRFFERDIQDGDGQAAILQAATLPAWLDEHWYRQLVTPLTTPPTPSNALHVWLRAPFHDPAPLSLVSPYTGVQVGLSWTGHAPHPTSTNTGRAAALAQSAGPHELARVGLRAQRRYRIKARDWATRWRAVA
ncbi:hypothetical protein JCM10908_001857 [Rhodotorula pacifica]|uniref:uncharacterized protein n=1 Tax=Rhodotorula pacifica TaxID=1495444 RepID=UPI00317F4C91